MAAMDWRDVLDASQFRINHSFSIASGATKGVIMRFPVNTGVRWAYGITPELLQTEGAAFNVKSTNGVTVSDYGSELLAGAGRVNLLYDNEARTKFYLDPVYTILTGTGIHAPYEVMIGNSTGGPYQYTPVLATNISATIILAGGSDLLFEMENLGNDTGTFNMSFIIQETRLPNSSFQTQ
jgi:hypothetical protein